MNKIKVYSIFPGGEVSKTRGHRRKREERIKKDLRSNLFTQRVVPIRNELPEESKEVVTMMTSKVYG